MTDKIDFKKRLKTLYGPTRSKGIHIVNVPTMRFLMADGFGDPNTSGDYADVVAALYSVAYGIRAASKTQLKRDYVVPPLEGLWWADDMNDFVSRAKNRWHWTMMIMVPDWIGPALIARTIELIVSKKNPPAMDRIRVDVLEEGRAAQVLHIGSYDDEGPALAKLHEDYLPGINAVPTGKHHEIYLSDPRRVPAEKLKTILRQPIKERPRS
ncbi:GyrI-like domain-containing protein [Pelagibacterium luteolum]|uniref:GyrI-like small molecule binding domain-containing protein n=1 Tax=Pelagibacterium luteolum TaxID=440168 RepID=A0A1G7UPV3_9HYPH|nr:GyrI-like domain-containing protein [Pelagibacterium luteolum]SDG48740.1 hypothetical protein SAMN04487974_103162 [Pelagibacterium luteolum]